MIMVQWSEHWQLLGFHFLPFMSYSKHVFTHFYNGLYTRTHLATMHVLHILKNVKLIETNEFVYQT